MSEQIITCGLCESKAYPKPEEPHRGLPRCGRCGAIEIETGAWVYKCAECGERVDELHGLMVPHLCRTCVEATAQKQRDQGYVCSRCRQPFILCPH